MNKVCPFCQVVSTDSEKRIISQTEYSFVIRDGFPVSSGHTLIIPKRHVPSIFEVSSVEKDDLFDQLTKARIQLDTEYHPDAYNIGVNDGVAAGQTVLHLHIHLIPRYNNDVPDPRGGVRWVKPDRAVYWAENK